MSNEFRFKNVRKGQPIAADDLPRLPPRAFGVVRKVFAEHDIAPQEFDPNSPNGPSVLASIACNIVHLSLRRIERNLTLNDIMDDEDLEEVVRAFNVIREQNPTIFPKKSPADAREEQPADPTNAASAPSSSPGAQSGK